jgi:hypothetical protein
MGSAMRRKPPAPGSLEDELRIILNGAGLPTYEGEGDRTSVCGTRIVMDGDHAVIEWFVSRSARAAAATEHTEGIAFGLASAFHSTARHHIHTALFSLLNDLGYKLSPMEDGKFLVGKDRDRSTAALAADIRRQVGAPADTDHEPDTGTPKPKAP